ncbi:MAG TPA: dTMP kinase [Thiobacillaceae bacterium]|nr:dTMP kinase [Thiobacillaceae bacterium]HNU63577.1 dTMP kinase [Thiobacillaceae bacterium]
MDGLFISLEGVDGAGKSSHLDWLGNWFRQRGHRVRMSREPGGTPVGERLRDIVLHADMHVETEALIMFAARREHLDRVIRPALAAGEVVISDRFTDASFAYQCGGRGLAEARMQTLEDWVQQGLQPHLTLLFDISPEVAAARLRNVREADRFERERMDFHVRVRDAYLRRAQAHPRRIQVIDAGTDLQGVRRQLERTLTRFLETRA